MITTDNELDIDTQDIDNQQEDIDQIKAENERLKAQVEADKHIKERLSKKKETWTIDKEALYNEFSQRQQLESFMSANPTLLEKKEELVKLSNSGITLDEAKLIIEKRDPTIYQRKKSNDMSLIPWEAPSNSGVYTQEDMASMPPEQAQALWLKANRGEITIK